MLGDITVAENICIACGYTDMRKSIDGLAGIVQQQFQLDPFSNSLFLFYGRNRNKMKALLWEGDGFVLLYITDFAANLSEPVIVKIFGNVVFSKPMLCRSAGRSVLALSNDVYPVRPADSVS